MRTYHIIGGNYDCECIVVFVRRVFAIGNIKLIINIIIGVPICALIVYGIFNMLTIAGVPSGTLQEAVLGLVVIVFAVLAQRKQKKEKAAWN